MNDAYCDSDILEELVYDIRKTYKDDKLKLVDVLTTTYNKIYGSDPEVTENPETGEYESPIFGDEMSLDDLIDELELYVTDIDEQVTEKKLHDWFPNYDIYEVETQYDTYGEPWD